MRRIQWKYVLIGVVSVLILATGAFVLWAETPMTPTVEALAALKSDSEMTVTNQNGWMVFTPADKTPTTGFIFYPGGRVDARAYAPQLRAIAEAGYLTVIESMPLNLAVFGVNEANEVVKAFPSIEHWAVGGHSLGGSMAARYVQSNPEVMQGLVFWASYPDVDLSGFNIHALSIYGTSDGVAKRENIENSKNLLPSDAVFVSIEGGNHSQFGWYGLQPGDNEAGISQAEQQTQTVSATTDLLAQLESSSS